MEKNPLNLDYLFEVSWEVCNLVGGIYTVLSTKAKTLQQINKDRNVFIGPDLWKEKKSSYFIIGYTQRSQSRARAEPPFCISLGGVLPHILPLFFH